MPRIVLDANFDDWKDVEPVVVDAADVPEGTFVDFGEVRVAVDDNFVHLLIDFGRTVNVQGLDGTARILLNADGDDNTGEAMFEVMGVDLIIECTPPNREHPGSPGRGIGILPGAYTPDPNNPNLPVLNPYDIGLAFAPTHAGRRIEFRIARGTFPNLGPLFQWRFFRGQVIFENLVNSIVDETPAFEVMLPERPKTATTQPDDAQQATDPLARADGAQARIMSWNAELGAIISRPEPFTRTISALQPDVILLQELTDKNTEQQVAEFLARLNVEKGAHPWHIVLGKGGGDLRCAVLSRFPLTSIKPLELIAFPGESDHTMRIAGALVDINGKKLLAISVHLKCCGRMGSPEDGTRLAEVTLLHAVLRKMVEDMVPMVNYDGLVIAGDFNLVGSREPLETMMTGLDLDRSVMGLVDAYQIDGLSNLTWADRRQPFVPGRLDYAVFSDSTLEAKRSFVYDTWDLAPTWRAHHGAQAEDTSLASDHLPVVFDVLWK